MRCHPALDIFASTITNVVEDVAAQTDVRIVLSALIVPIVIKRRFAAGNTRSIYTENVEAIVLGQSVEEIEIVLKQHVVFLGNA